MNDPRTDYLEQQVNLLIARLAAAEALLTKLSQRQWQLVGTPSIGTGGGQLRIATGAVPAKSGTTLGSATCNLYNLDAGTGALTAAGSGVVWNNSVHATSADLVVIQDAAGNWIAVAEFCP